MKYIVWFSGWIDSTFVAYHLKQLWHEVLLVNLKNTAEKNKCCSLPTELMKIADFLWLPLKIVDVMNDFKQFVIDDFIDSYLKWYTPNPCVNCNYRVRFRILDKIRQELGYDFVATGHYVNKLIVKSEKWRIEENKLINKWIVGENQFYTFSIPKDTWKDQTYMLYKLLEFQDIIKHLDFPLANFDKSEVKRILEENNIPINTSKESQNVCFIPDDDYPRFIKQNKNINISWWKIVDLQWNYLWEHKWLIYYTIWQRKGLNLNTSSKKYVIKLDYRTNTLIVWDNKDLFQNIVEVIEPKVLVFENIEYLDNIYWKIRYKWKLTKVKKIENNTVEFEEPVRAVTPWQHLVLYWEKDWRIFVIWWGTITN